MQKKYFCDTNVLMQYSDVLFEKLDNIIICGYVLDELDKHKMSSDENKKYMARQASRSIDKFNEKVKFVVNEGSFSLPLSLSLDSMDNKILSVLMDLYINDKSIITLSNDLLFREKCRLLDIPCEKFEDNKGSPEDVYKGYKIITLDEQQMSEHYQDPINKYGLLNNEYLLIKNNEGITVDRQRWTEDKGFTPLNTRTLKSIYFGDVKPKDDFQMMAIDSLNNADLTLLFGVAGSAKTLLSLAWMMQNIQNQKINKGVIIFHPVPLHSNQSLGFYPGDRNQKLLQTSLGGILSSKLGDMTLVETLINQGKLMIVPTSDIRGIEISDNDCLFITEAQNTDAYTMRTILQRAKEKCKIIVEGDMLEQQDLRNISNKENGMSRIIDIFKGTKYFSCVKLKNTYRSPIAEIAQNI